MRLLAPQLIFLIVSFVYAGSLVCWLPLQWPRYVHVLHPFVILFQSAVPWLAVDRTMSLLSRTIPSLRDRVSSGLL
jgi:hypothetical protein